MILCMVLSHGVCGACAMSQWAQQRAQSPVADTLHFHLSGERHFLHFHRVTSSTDGGNVRGHLSTLRLVFAACCIVRRKAIIKQCANIIMLATKHLRCTVWSSEHTEAMALLADGLRACFL